MSNLTEMTDMTDTLDTKRFALVAAGALGAVLAILFNVTTLLTGGLQIGHLLFVAALPIGAVLGRSRGHSWHWIANWTLWLGVFGLLACVYRPRMGR